MVFVAGLFLDVVSGGWSWFLVSGWNIGFYHVCGGALLGFERSVVFVWLRFLCVSQGSPGCVGGFLGVCVLRTL